MSNLLLSDYNKIFLEDTPMIDLRSPAEFKQGAFAHSTNFPLMSDDERAQIGLCYKKKGQQQAIELGHQLVNGSKKEQRVECWRQFAEQHPNKGILYCFRGGLRSRISQQWLSEAGVDLPIVHGGYKAMGRFLIDETQRLTERTNIFVLTGFTGSAKTKIINRNRFSIDLECLANHRGSSFGRRITPQPSQIDFENSLAVELLKLHHHIGNNLVLEDESRLIGARSIPLVIKQKMDVAPLVLIEQEFDYRVEQIYQDYVVALASEFNAMYKQQSIVEYHQFLSDACTKISRRLGGVGLAKVLQLIEQAILLQQKNTSLLKHRDWIVYLLKNYYDPMYSYQIEKKKSRIIFQGNMEQVSLFLDQISQVNVNGNR